MKCHSKLSMIKYAFLYMPTEQVYWCKTVHGNSRKQDQSLSETSKIEPGQNSQLVIELSEQVSALSGELEQAKLTIAHLSRQENT